LLQVQSSIISTTTDGVSQLDWRSIRRHRTTTTTSHHQHPAAATAPRNARPLVDTRPSSPSALADTHRPKRKYCRRQTAAQDLVYGLGSSYVAGSRVAVAKPSHQRGVTAAPGRKGRPPASLDGRGGRAALAARKRPAPHHAEYPSTGGDGDGGKNYVKIPGHYQDDFVYYATKRARGRPRKTPSQDPPQSAAGLTTGHSRSTGTVGGINVFDWYREMALTDKSTRFGVSTTTTDEAPAPRHASPGWADTTPVDESAVADLVMDMLPPSSAAASASVSITLIAKTLTTFHCPPKRRQYCFQHGRKFFFLC